MRTINTTPKHKFTYIQNPNPLTFAILDGDQYLHTPFMCKDYLQDIFWSVYTNKSVPEIHGLIWAAGWLKEQECFEIALADMNSALSPKCARMQEFLNLFDVALEIEETVISHTTDDKIVVVNFSKAWATSGPMISAFTSLIRLSGGYDGSGAVAYLTGLAKADPIWMSPEIQRKVSVVPRLFALLQGKRPNRTWDPVQGIHTTHNEGIVGFAAFPTVML